MAGLKIFETQRTGKNYLQFDFQGELTSSLANEGITQWQTLMAKAPANEKVNLIYNCREMTGFETEARKRWQETMKAYKPRVQDVWVISENVFILGAAKTMGLLAGYNMKVCRSLEDVGK